MRYLDPSYASASSYQNRRHASLNFESVGGETYSKDDASLRPLATIMQFPTRVAKWITVNINRKEITMTKDRDSAENDSPTSSIHNGVRVETFQASGPLFADVSTKSGDLTVLASKVDVVTVTLRASSSKNAYLLEHADVIFDAKNNTLTVHTLPSGISLSSSGLRIGPKKSWFMSSDLDVTVEVPEGTSLEASTVSGDASLSGRLGKVKVRSVSGDVDVHDSAEALDVQTASGDVNTEHVVTTLTCKSASGDVVCKSTATKTEIYSASGDVRLSADQPGKIVVRNVSGDVTVRVAHGLAVDISGDSVSGDLGSNIDLNGSGDDGGEELVIKVTTVSGDIRIDKAS